MAPCGVVDDYMMFSQGPVEAEISLDQSRRNWRCEVCLVRVRVLESREKAKASCSPCFQSVLHMYRDMARRLPDDNDYF